MRRVVARVLVAFGSGLVFGAGLLLSGMTRPAKIIAFLDPFGAWDPSLALVMAGAVSVYALGVRSAGHRPAPLAAPSFSALPVLRIDGPLVAGSAIFGVGWGLGGYCPGPGLVALGSGALGVSVFVAFMLLGSLGAASFASRQEARASVAPPGGRGSEALQS